MRKDKKNQVILYLGIVFISILSFILIYGYKIINPTYDDWLMQGGDLSQHYIGWEAYRNSKWVFPFGLFDNIIYPQSVSIMFTDSIPLLAVFFKLLSPVLPQTFQYWGIYGLLSFIMLGILSAFILKKYVSNVMYVWLGSCFILFSPYVLQRMYIHEALAGGQWLILLAFTSILFYEEYFSNRKNAIILWAFIGFISVAIHMYFSAMCLIVLFGFVFYDFINQKKLMQVMLYLLIYLLSMTSNIFLLGGIGGGSKAATGYGYFSANMNALFNPQGYSRIFKAIKMYSDDQWEGYAYLGLGVFVLSLISFFVLQELFKKKLINTKKVIAFTIIIILAFGYALSNKITYNDKLILTVPLPNKIENLFAIFRASGRFMWLVCYTIILGAIIILSASKSIIKAKSHKTIILGVCLLLQIFDLSVTINNNRKKYSNAITYVDSYEENNKLKILLVNNDIKHINIVDPQTDDTYYEIAHYAMKHNLTTNRFNTVHSVGRENEDEIAIRAIENAEKNTLYFIDAKHVSICLKYSLNAYIISNDFVVGCVGDLNGIMSDINAEEYIFRFSDSQNNYLKNGRDDTTNGVRYLYEGGMSYGPYIRMESGSYHFAITGLNLNNCDFYVTSDAGVNSYELTNLTRSGDKVEFDVSFPEYAEDVEIVINNRNEYDVELYSISLRYN